LNNKLAAAFRIPKGCIPPNDVMPGYDLIADGIVAFGSGKEVSTLAG
jgi:hypothetical protein